MPNAIGVTARVRHEYQTPWFDIHDLALVTLGGSPGGGDSGASGAENPFGQTSPSGEKDEWNDDWVGGDDG